MSIKELIFRNLMKNIKNYYLYVFALVFSVALYFAFVTLQYDPAMDADGSIKGEAAIKAASVLLISIVTVFLLYANNLFIKRRSKEIGLLQLVGFTKGKIFRILSAENIILYFSSIVIGIFLGFSSSKLMMMILLTVIGIDEVAALRFSMEAFNQTIIVFTAIYVVIMLSNAIFIKRQRILALFHVRSTSELKVSKMSGWQFILGLIGIGLISYGYYLSTQLFSGVITGVNQLLLTMLTILGTVIVGTYLFYKGSITLLFHFIRERNRGFLSINKVLSLSSIMFRMKTNSLLLTVITTISALAIGLLSLSYISYYSAEKSAEQAVPHHFSIPNEERAMRFMDALKENEIDYSVFNLDTHQFEVDISGILKSVSSDLTMDVSNTTFVVINEEDVVGLDVKENESVFVNFEEVVLQFMSFKDSGNIVLNGKNESFHLQYSGIHDARIIPLRLTNGGSPVIVVDAKVYEKLIQDVDKEVQGEFSQYFGININKKSEIKRANELFTELEIHVWAAHQSQLQLSESQKQIHGLSMFIVGFLGLTFLITSGCILYFKQMDEGEEEKGSYTILRKLGFTKKDLLNGIKYKQLFNFGIPLMLGLSHSYFAVKSGWFFFGTEMWTPMVIVMIIYTLLYSIFGLLSVLYYKKVIHHAL